MAEYIEREAARPDEFCVGVSCQECPFLKDPLYGGCRVDDFIMALPPADVRPVVRGEWIDDGCITRCKYCGEEKEFPHWRFCPNCGADMRETKE